MAVGRGHAVQLPSECDKHAARRTDRSIAYMLLTVGGHNNRHDGLIDHCR